MNIKWNYDFVAIAFDEDMIFGGISWVKMRRGFQSLVTL